MGTWSIWHWLIVILVAVILLAVYFIPTFIAFVRGHDHRMVILLLNLFLGWTAIGWIFALIWSVLSTRKMREGQRATRISN